MGHPVQYVGEGHECGMTRAPSEPQIFAAIRELAKCHSHVPKQAEVDQEREYLKSWKKLPPDLVLFTTPCRRFAFATFTPDCLCGLPVFSIGSAVTQGMAIHVVPPSEVTPELLTMFGNGGYVATHVEDYIEARERDTAFIEEIVRFPDPVVGGVQ